MPDGTGKAVTKVDNVRALLDKMKPQMQMALPRHITPERMVRVAMTAVMNTPKLLDCSKTSLLSAVMSCAQLGLEPDGVLGQAYLVPFRGQVQFIPGYKGLIDLARRSGDVLSIQAKVVREGDHFDYQYGLVDKLEHKEAPGRRDKPITHVWFKATFKDGGFHWDVMTVDEIEQIRDQSEGYRAFKNKKIKSNPWDSHFGELAKKTIIRRNAKYLPMSVQRAAAVVDAHDRGDHVTMDRYGDLVIDGAAEEVVEEPPAEHEEGAQSRLDSFADGAPAEPQSEDTTAPDGQQTFPAIPVPMTDNNEPDWLSFCNQFKEALAKLPDDEARANMVDAHASVLSNLKRQNPGFYEDLLGNG